jgi:hypothetical protein
VSVRVWTAAEMVDGDPIAQAPRVLRRALGEVGRAIWLAPGRTAGGSLTALVAALDAAPIVLVPAIEEPLDVDGELDVLAGGVYDAGVLAVRRGAEPFLDWWQARLDAEPDLATPQRWLNLVPGYFDCTVLRDPLPISRAPASLVAEPPEPAPVQAEAATPPAPPSAPAPAELAPGVNLVLRASDEPLASLARDVEACLCRLGIPYARTELAYGEGGSRLEGADPRAAPFDTDLVCLNPLDLAAFAFHVDAGFFSLRRSIGVWLLEEVPVPDVGRVSGYLDELWTAPAAVSALGARAGTPTRPIPVPVHAGRPSRRAGGFEVVTVATLGGPFAPGTAERANAVGALRAYARAFGPEDGATLAVRTSTGAQDVPALEELKLETDRADVSVVDGPLTTAERQALVASASCYLSLARSTELDLPALEALAAGTPVVATGAGLEVDGFVRVRSDSAPLPEAFRTAFSGAEWIEPDLDDAARLLRRVRDEPARDEAADSVRRLHSSERLEAFLAERLSSLLPTPTGSRARRALARILG